MNGIGGATVQEIGCSVKGFDPKGWRQASLEEECANNVVRSANKPLSLAVLWRGVRT